MGPASTDLDIVNTEKNLSNLALPFHLNDKIRIFWNTLPRAFFSDNGEFKKRVVSVEILLPGCFEIYFNINNDSLIGLNSYAYNVNLLSTYISFPV